MKKVHFEAVRVDHEKVEITGGLTEEAQAPIAPQPVDIDSDVASFEMKNYIRGLYTQQVVPMAQET